MSWLRIDDDFYDHPKIVAAGPLAIALHVLSMAYASRHGTDGFIPAAMLPWLVRFDGIQLTLGLDARGPAMAVDVSAIAARLVDLDLWHWAEAPCARCAEVLENRDARPATAAGYLIHDFLEYNPTAEEVSLTRVDRTAQRRLAGKARAASAQRVAGRFAASAEISTALSTDRKALDGGGVVSGASEGGGDTPAPPAESPANDQRAAGARWTSVTSPVPARTRTTYVGTRQVTPAQEVKATVRAVLDEWRKARRGTGLERFTDPQAIAGLKLRTKSALAAGVTFEDLRVAIVRHAHDPKANPWYIDEWAREIRASREEAEHVARKAQERRELDAIAEREQGRLRPLGAILEDARRRSVSD